jgi:ubiquinone/menaquinone biosynthesis C-methylase UbiE
VNRQAIAWKLFERDPAAYESWYTTPRGRLADSAERALLEHLFAPFARAGTVLEVGCGTGHFTRWLADRFPCVVGIDRAPAMLAEARRRNPGLPLLLGDAHDLPVRSRSVDLGVFITALEFLEEPAQALAEALRVVRRGVVVVALNRWSVGGFSRRWGRDAQGPLLGHARDFTRASLRALASMTAGPRLRRVRSASALFPGGLLQSSSWIPLGDVIGIALELRP